MPEQLTLPLHPPLDERFSIWRLEADSRDCRTCRHYTEQDFPAFGEVDGYAVCRWAGGLHDLIAGEFPDCTRTRPRQLDLFPTMYAPTGRGVK